MLLVLPDKLLDLVFRLACSDCVSRDCEIEDGCRSQGVMNYDVSDTKVILGDVMDAKIK